MGYRDMDLDDQVRAALRRDKQIAPLRLDVNVRNGIVHLKGSVSPGVHAHVLATVRGVESVAAVVDEMSTSA